LWRASTFCDCQIAAVYHLTIFTFIFADYVDIYLSTAAFNTILRTLSLGHSKHTLLWPVCGSHLTISLSNYLRRAGIFRNCQIAAVYHLTIFTFTFSNYVHIYFSTATFAVPVHFRHINVSLDHSKHQHHHKYMATPAPSILVMFACFKFAPLHRIIPTELGHVTINSIHN